MNELLVAYKKVPYAAKIALLTLYIALVNSYALFIVYPIIKTSDGLSILSSLVIYICITLPLFVYLFRHIKQKPLRPIVIGGLVAMLGATIFQYFTSDISISILLLHAGFYLAAGIVEEALWRGKLWQLVSKKVTQPVIVLSIVTIHFVVLHIPFALLEKENPIGFLGQVLLLGVALGTLRIITKKVSIPAFAHAAVNMVVYT